jgi:hypothetical protein
MVIIRFDKLMPAAWWVPGSILGRACTLGGFFAKLIGDENNGNVHRPA